MLQKTLHIQVTNPYLAIIDDDQYYTGPVDMDRTPILEYLLAMGKVVKCY